MPRISKIVTLAALLVMAWDTQAEPVPGNIVDYSPVKSRCYLGSPSLARLPNGELLASHDIFGPGSTRDTTKVFGSTDGGATWGLRATIRGQWWSTLFSHRGAAYLIGTTKEYGQAVIRKSVDGGRTWTEPRDSASGLLLAEGKYHCAPVPVVEHEGRICRAMESYTGPTWGAFESFVMSAPADADLLKAANWTCSNRLAKDPSWAQGKFGGWLEGNVVPTRDGGLVNILRADVRSLPEKAAIIQVSRDGKSCQFDPVDGFIDFPGGCKKFVIRYDPASGKYWALANYVPKAYAGHSIERTRNTLALISSSDLKKWEVARTVLSHPDPVKHGFQYPDWLFDGNDLIGVVRTAFDEPDGSQANNCHDANYMIFIRIPNFRNP